MRRYEKGSFVVSLPFSLTGVACGFPGNICWEKICLRGRSVCSTGDGSRKGGESMAGDGLLQSKRRIRFGAEKNNVKIYPYPTCPGLHG